MCMTNDVLCTWSPRQQLSGWTVLLTGSLGFLGSVVLEQILRLTEVRAASNTLMCCTPAVQTLE